ncbi:hypothetical protein C2I36_09815 [Rhodobacteraceae bacterium WD3A24]|nr:hypothetical protein C2I36_09815 [Rhodobacteraceae bacterium WD3A24]
MLGWLAARPWARKAALWGAIALAVALFLLGLRKAGERAGRAAERVEYLEREVQRARATQRRMRNADTGDGDPAADREWLRRRGAR